MENFLETIIISSTIYTFYKLISNYEFFSEPKLYVKFNDKDAIMPYRATKESAGLDLFSCENGIIEPHSKKMIDIGISVKIPYGYYGRIAPRSGLTIKKSIDVGAGVIDSDYRGNISVILFNHGDERFSFSIGDKLAQLIIEKIAHVTMISVRTLDYTNRGADGFGSTGISNLNIGINYNGNENEKNYFSKNTEEETSEEENSEEDNSEEDNSEETSKEENSKETSKEENSKEENSKETSEEKNSKESSEENSEENSEESSGEEKEDKYVKIE
jgi:dUTP pyrophosphatase